MLNGKCHFKFPFCLIRPLVIIEDSCNLKCVPTIYFCVHIMVSEKVNVMTSMMDNGHGGAEMLFLTLKFFSLPVPTWPGT